METEEPQVEVETTQQTPNPAAQVPLAEPPLLAHSEEVKQVPRVVEELLLVHSSLGNWTILNSENCSKHINMIMNDNRSEKDLSLGRVSFRNIYNPSFHLEIFKNPFSALNLRCKHGLTFISMVGERMVNEEKYCQYSEKYLHCDSKSNGL